MARPTTKGWGVVFEDPVPGDVVKCLDELGIEIHRVDNEEAQGRCPAHFERTGKEDAHPSWSVNTEDGQHNCFSCGFRGPFVSLVKYALNCSLEDAVAWVKVRGSIDRARKLLHGGGQFINELTDIPEITEADLALYDQVPEWACDERDLAPESVDHYGILWDSKREHWITPIRDPETHRLWGWQEKGQNTRYFRNYPSEIKKSKTLFGVKQFKGDTAILVESPLDTSRIHTAGIEGALSSFGAHVSDAQIGLMVEIGVRVLISALDNDRDGINANDALRQRVRGRMRLKFWNYGALEAKDPGDQDDEEIQESYATAYSSVLWRP